MDYAIPGFILLCQIVFAIGAIYHAKNKESKE